MQAWALIGEVYASRQPTSGPAQEAWMAPPLTTCPPLCCPALCVQLLLPWGTPGDSSQVEK